MSAAEENKDTPDNEVEYDKVVVQGEKITPELPEGMVAIDGMVYSEIGARALGLSPEKNRKADMTNDQEDQHENRHWVEIHHQAIDKLGEVIVLITPCKRMFVHIYGFIHDLEIENEYEFEFNTWKKKVVIETGIISIKHARKNAAAYQGDYLIVRDNLFTIDSVTDRGGKVVEMHITSVRTTNRL